MQITVALADGAALLTHAQLRQRVMQIVMRPVDKKSQLRDRSSGVEVAQQSGQIAEYGIVQIRRMREINVEGCHGQTFMKSRQSLCEIHYFLLSDVTALEQCRQLLSRVKLPHAYDVLDNHAVASHVQATRFPSDGNHVQIQVARQPSVEPQFLVAKMVPFRQSRRIEEIQSDALFDLVGKGVGEDYPRNIRLANAQPIHRMSVCRRRQHVRNIERFRRDTWSGVNRIGSHLEPRHLAYRA